MQQAMPKIILSNSKHILRLLTGEEKIILPLVASILFSFTMLSNTYADDVDYSVIVEPVLSITTSGDTDGVVSLDLNPETKTFASKDLTVTVNTNNETGYKLYVNTAGDTTNLVEKNDSNLYIETLSSEVSESNFTANRWGYKLNSSSTNYAPFVSGTLVNSSNIATSGVSSTLTFGAKASYDTKAGSYALALNFQATANPKCDTTVEGSMQEFEPCPDLADGTNGTLTDSRDNNSYNVRLINGNWWMVQNLRYVGDTGSDSTTMKMKAATSNISSDQDLAISDLSLGNDYSNARIHDSGNTTNGVWYNYAAASAGYVTSSQHSADESAESVCPKNWRLPTNSEMGGITSYQSAFFNGGSGVTGGYYRGGSVRDTGDGYWWSSTPYSSDSNLRYLLYYNGSSLRTGYVDRNLGFYVRCVRSS